VNRVRGVKLTSRSVVFALAVHGLILLLLGLSIDWKSDSIPMAANQAAPVQAQAIAAADLDKELKKIKDREYEKIKKQQDEEKKLKELKEEQEREKKKLADLEKKAREAEAQRVIEEQQRKENEAKQLALAKEKEKKEQTEAEKKRKEDEAKKKRLAEQKKKEEEAKRLAEEKKREAAEKEKQRLAELKRQEDLKRQQAERELQDRLEDERNERLATSTFTNQYVAAIQQKVSSNWIRPPGAQQGLTALVAVRVTPAGDVLSARVVRGSGDPIFDRSVINAVLKASPLPFPQDPKFYEFLREFNLDFRPDHLVS